MKLSRRKFMLLSATSMSLGLITLYGWKNSRLNKIFSNEIEKFFYNFESILPYETTYNIDIEVYTFENKIISMLSTNGLSKTINLISQKIKKEYQLGKVTIVKGWIISETELKILILKSKYV